MRSHSEPPMASLEGLPDDVMAHVFDHLGDAELARLRQVSRRMDRRIIYQGIPQYLSSHQIPSRTLSPPAKAWPKPLLFGYNARIERALQSHTLHSVQLGAPWPHTSIPALSLTSDALILGVGTSLVLHPLVATREYAPKTLLPARAYSLSASRAGSDADVVGVHSLPDSSLAVAHYNGVLQRVTLGHGPRGGGVRSTAHYMHPRAGGGENNIQALSGDGYSLLTTSLGKARLFNAKSPWTPAVEMDLDGARTWSCLLSERTAVVGMMGGIQVSSLSSTGFEKERILHGVQPEHSAAYGLCLRPGGQELLSAWYDGVARLHDLRTKEVAPVLELCDPWADSALYSAAYVGAYGVAAGWAEHGTVSVWDIRRPHAGWSVFSPNGRGSPVYALQADGGRLWGVSEKRAFVLAFDGSGDQDEGILVRAARAPPPHKGARDVPNGYGRRGGKWKWTVHYGEHAVKETSMGYRHADRGMTLFESKTLV